MEHGRNERGFVNGVAKWNTLLLCPVSPYCTVCVQTAGEVTTAEIDRLIENLQLQRSAFPTRTEIHAIAGTQEER
jgi:hypothetical protein